MSAAADEIRRCRESLCERIATARLTDYTKFQHWWDELSYTNRIAIIRAAGIEGKGVECYAWGNFPPAEQDAIARAGMRAWLVSRQFPGELLA